MTYVLVVSFHPARQISSKFSGFDAGISVLLGAVYNGLPRRRRGDLRAV